MSETGDTILATLTHPADFDAWRWQVRRLVGAGVSPADVTWRIGEADAGLFAPNCTAADLPEPDAATAPRAPKSFAELARVAICHKAEDRFVLLHRLLERLQTDRALLRIASDPDVARAEKLAKNVRRCSHKMKAFVRFRSTHDPDGVERFVAWFEPEHHTLDFTAGFFVRRFAEMRWSILTPDRSAHYDGKTLTVGEGASRDIAPDGDVNEDLWRTYFGAIFNPARLMVNAMTSEMPKRYWKNMPEGEMIAPLIKSATDRTAEMVAAAGHAPARSTRISRQKRSEAAALAETPRRFAHLRALMGAAAACTRCPLHGPATQTVLGEGPLNAPLMFVGEQPGDQEDIQGKPFVGPAGQLFDRALAEAGIERRSTFVTNAVKHFKFEPRGKRRIHKTPAQSEVEHCRFWLEEERRLVRPKLTVALGATAARALGGKAVTISRTRGRILKWPDGSAGFVTVHPSYLLRLPSAEAKRTAYEEFLADLATIRGWLAEEASVHEAVIAAH